MKIKEWFVGYKHKLKRGKITDNWSFFLEKELDLVGY